MTEYPGGRDSKGRFVRGNPGGPGNPFARQTAALRKALIEAVSTQDIQEITSLILLKAKSGDPVFIRLLFDYVIGKPQPPVEPDRLDELEWQQLKRNTIPEQDSQIFGQMTADVACQLAEVTLPRMQTNIYNELAHALNLPVEPRQQTAETGWETRSDPVNKPVERMWRAANDSAGQRDGARQPMPPVTPPAPPRPLSGDG